MPCALVLFLPLCGWSVAFPGFGHTVVIRVRLGSAVPALGLFSIGETWAPRLMRGRICAFHFIPCWFWSLGGCLQSFPSAFPFCSGGFGHGLLHFLLPSFLQNQVCPFFWPRMRSALIRPLLFLTEGLGWSIKAVGPLAALLASLNAPNLREEAG